MDGAGPIRVVFADPASRDLRVRLRSDLRLELSLHRVGLDLGRASESEQHTRWSRLGFARACDAFANLDGSRACA
jgi:hypothetical protein